MEVQGAVGEGVRVRVGAGTEGGVRYECPHAGMGHTWGTYGGVDTRGCRGDTGKGYGEGEWDGLRADGVLRGCPQ